MRLPSRTHRAVGPGQTLQMQHGIREPGIQLVRDLNGRKILRPTYWCWPLPICPDSWTWHSKFLCNIALYSIGSCFYHQSHPQLGIVFALVPSLHSFWSYFSICRTCRNCYSDLKSNVLVSLGGGIGWSYLLMMRRPWGQHSSGSRDPRMWTGAALPPSPGWPLTALHVWQHWLKS